MGLCQCGADPGGVEALAPPLVEQASHAHNRISDFGGLDRGNNGRGRVTGHRAVYLYRHELPCRSGNKPVRCLGRVSRGQVHQADPFCFRRLAKIDALNAARINDWGSVIGIEILVTMNVAQGYVIEGGLREHGCSQDGIIANHGGALGARIGGLGQRNMRRQHRRDRRVELARKLGYLRGANLRDVVVHALWAEVFEAFVGAQIVPRRPRQAGELDGTAFRFYVEELWLSHDIRILQSEGIEYVYRCRPSKRRRRVVIPDNYRNRHRGLLQPFQV